MPKECALKPELLFLCQVLPYPPDGGVYIRSHYVLALLAERFRVTAVCFFRRAQHKDAHSIRRALAQLERYATIEVHPIPQEWSRTRLMWDHLRSLVTGRVYTYFQYDSALVHSRIAALLEQHSFALVHVDSFDLLRYFPDLAGLPIACTHHNLESALLKRRAARERARWRAMYVRYQSWLMERAESSTTPRLGVNITVSQEDADRLREIAPLASIAVVANGVDVSAFQPAPLEGSGEIVFVGALHWFPNLDGLEYFADEILPRLRSRGVSTAVRCIGMADDNLRVRFARLGIELTGYVDDIRPYLRRAACCIVPLRIGGGTRLKILDAWALGKAVVSTSIGAEGLRTVDGTNILIRDDPEQFAAGIEAVLRDKSTRLNLEAGGRSTAEAFYSWDGIGGALDRAYSPLLLQHDGMNIFRSAGRLP
jgi:polysaccharide biosynthesis protein PslH